MMGIDRIMTSTRNELIFVLDGDDHERREYEAVTEEDAREQCANDFNAQYGHCDCDGEHDDDDSDECTRAEYEGDEFDLVGVYTGELDDPDTWKEVSSWPRS